MRNFKVYVNGKEYEVAVEEASTGTTSSVVEEKQVVQEKKKSVTVAKPAEPIVASDSSDAGEKIEAPFPGVVLKLLKANGDEVKKGEAILVIEAMKMENDIASPIDGILSLKVQAGANVDTGETLAIIV